MDKMPDHTEQERIITFASATKVETLADGVEFRLFVSSTRGATGFSTGLMEIQPSASLPYHIYSYSQALTVVEGRTDLLVDGRSYRLGPGDCAHIPAAVPRSFVNYDPEMNVLIHLSFASANPALTLLNETPRPEEGAAGTISQKSAETITIFEESPVYELSKNAFFTDLFARRMGAEGICGGYGRFLPGASLPCHTHDFDESITIVKGTAACLVEGRRHDLSDCATAHVPTGLRHRFVNTSTEEMAMIWVYAGDEPDRSIVDNSLCSEVIA